MTPKRKYYLANEEALKIKRRLYMRQWQRDNREIANTRSKKYYDENTVVCLERARKQREKKPEYQAEYRRANREECNARTRRWQKQNRDRTAAICARYRANKLQATPKWLTEEDLSVIQLFYTEAARLTKLTGIRFEVDHIVPLQGENVCGLHVPWNLSLLTRYENAAKGNKLGDASQAPPPGVRQVEDVR